MNAKASRVSGSSASRTRTNAKNMRQHHDIRMPAGILKVDFKCKSGRFRRYARYEIRIMHHVKMNKIAAIVEMIVKTVIKSGIASRSAVPTSIQSDEKINAVTGTDVFESRRNARGASFSSARPKSILLVEKTSQFADDMADVVTTKLITPAAVGRPASKNNSTNGLRFGATFAHDDTAIMQVNEST